MIGEFLRKKGVIPYEYIDSFEKFNETNLQPTQKFYSSLTNGDISEEDYEHAQKYGKNII